MMVRVQSSHKFPIYRGLLEERSTTYGSGTPLYTLYIVVFGLVLQKNVIHRRRKGYQKKIRLLQLGQKELTRKKKKKVVKLTS